MKQEYCAQADHSVNPVKCKICFLTPPQMDKKIMGLQERVRNLLKSNTIRGPRSQLNLINFVCKINFGWALIGILGIFLKFLHINLY